MTNSLLESESPGLTTNQSDHKDLFHRGEGGVQCILKIIFVLFFK